MSAPKKPTALKLLHGTDRADRANPGEPKPSDLPADAMAPEWLTERGKQAWADIRPLLTGMKVLTVADPLALALLCDALAEYIEARAWVNANEDVYSVSGKDGSLTWRKRPEVEIAQDAWRRAKTMLTEFGLTPASRARVSATGTGEGSPLAKWMAAT